MKDWLFLKNISNILIEFGQGPPWHEPGKKKRDNKFTIIYA